MNCYNCGKENNIDNKFCFNCGVNLEQKTKQKNLKRIKKIKILSIVSAIIDFIIAGSLFFFYFLIVILPFIYDSVPMYGFFLIFGELSFLIACEALILGINNIKLSKKINKTTFNLVIIIEFVSLFFLGIFAFLDIMFLVIMFLGVMYVYKLIMFLKLKKHKGLSIDESTKINDNKKNNSFLGICSSVCFIIFLTEIIAYIIAGVDIIWALELGLLVGGSPLIISIVLGIVSIYRFIKDKKNNIRK